MMINKLANAATFGFGSSLGRDLYKAAKKNPVIWAIIGVLLIAFGWRNLYMGVGRGAAYKFFVTYLGSLVLIAFGTAGFMGVGINAAQDNNAPIIIALALITLSSVAGNIWGMADRKNHVQAVETAQHNEAFMREIGLSDSDFDADLLQDEEGNLLKLFEQTDEKIVFSVSGRRGFRAAIKLNEGRMVDYTGIVKL
ncbi:hypothetical protein [Pseudovibrio sp. SCP19]|uniref:hypothetical protein n=1 Tax=Pseudovibrio sp. SCP19 TaxID=3141374 RepID=UPI00333C6F05